MLRYAAVFALAGTILIWGQPPGGRPGAGAPGVPPVPNPVITPTAPVPPPPARAVPITGLSAAEAALFQKGLAEFTAAEMVADGIGPRYNLDNCAGCHLAPAVGGSSAALNPQIAAASRFGARNTIPSFIRPDGPAFAVRFKRDAAGLPDGGVHNLFVITGRFDAPAGCQITQPDFSQVANLSLRIPTPMFGGGLIESISDSTLRSNLTANRGRAQALGISGRFNTSGNDGTITRFGWKAQNKSLDIFAGEAYNVEMGVTNELFPQEREENAACATNATPEDQFDTFTGALSDRSLITYFMRFLAPPPPAQPSASADRGRMLFDAVGCAVCHTPSLRTGKSSTFALSNRDVALYSDLAIHRMGGGLDDEVTQGAASGQEWRTAPLWGLNSRLFFLHDGRTRDLNQAILIHDSPGSEAHQVIGNYNGLTLGQRQDLINLLLSL